jgi:large subunit ribosomal protein L3
MTQLFDNNGEVRPATVIKAGPCVVTQVKTAAKDGYDAAQIGLVEFVKENRLNKPMKGHFDKHNLPPVKFMREVAILVGGAPKGTAEAGDGDGKASVKIGDRVLVDVFDGDKFVDVIGTTKGRGFAGVVKRHKFGAGPASHGSMFTINGSIGSSAFPSRVFPGMRMAGHMGNARQTTRNLRILGFDKDENLLVVEGAVPGPEGGYVMVRKALAPPRERRGFSGEGGPVNPLKASKRATKKK